jgi:hypothetical protein
VHIYKHWAPLYTLDGRPQFDRQKHQYSQAKPSLRLGNKNKNIKHITQKENDSLAGKQRKNTCYSQAIPFKQINI